MRQSFINCLKNLPIVFHETTYNLSKMEEQAFIDHVTKLLVAQQERRTKIEEDQVST